MKKAFRIIIPIVLSLSILLTALWYLFVYDREFTRDILLSCARYFEENGKHSTAQWFYDTAYAQLDDNDAIAIELSGHYRKNGNYTKAEYTLYKAIQDGGNADVYIALSKLYVEQDKLLDAANLLNNVTGDVKAELDKMRPDVPLPDPAPDFYSQYITVSLSAANGTMYVNANGQYPSVQNDLYQNPIALQEGENTIYAISVNEQGLVSPLAIYGYTLGGIIEHIQFADPAIEAEIRRILNVADTTVLYSNNLWGITEFTVPADAQNYSDLAYLTSLEKLIIPDGPENQLQALSGLSRLQTLEIHKANISTEELDCIGKLSNLQTLILDDCGITTAAPLSSLTNVTTLDLRNNTIRDISSLENMPQLQSVNLSHNALSDLSALKDCSKVESLDISYNAISTLAPITGLPMLKWLDASNNNITSLQGISKLTNLESLIVNSNQISDISPVVYCPKLIDFGCGSNQLSDISILASMDGLMYLDFSRNQVSELPKFTKESNLVTIDGSHNLITSVAPLAGLPMLNSVYMDYNEELKSISELATCFLLLRVDVYGTKVTDISSLTEMSVVVNYDPTQ